MTLGVFYSSYNNYDLLKYECLPRINFKDVKIINIDDHSLPSEQIKGKEICKKNNIPFILNEGKGLQFACKTAINYFKKIESVKWVICLQQDTFPLEDEFFKKLNNYIEEYSTQELGAFGFNNLFDNKYTKGALNEYKQSKKPKGFLGIFVFSDKRNLIQKSFFIDLLKQLVKYVIKHKKIDYIHCYRRWFAKTSFKNFDKISKKYNGLFAIDIPPWSAVAINIKNWEKYIKPDKRFIFHLWFNDISMQFLSNNIYVGCTSDFYIYNNQKIKTKYGIEEISVNQDQKNMPTNTEETLSYFRDKWGFSYIHPRANYHELIEKYKNTLIGKFLEHDCTKGPINVFKKTKNL